MALEIETERDIERLRQMALLPQAELNHLYARLAQLTDELAKARGEEVTTLQLELSVLRQQLASRSRALFGKSSEKRGTKEAPEEKDAQSGHGPTEQLALPVTEEVHVLDEADRQN